MKLICAGVLLTLSAGLPAQPRPAKVSGLSLAAKTALTAQMNEAVKSGDAPAIVETVVNREGIVYEGASGLPANAIFNIASMTKPVTSVAIMMLAEQGKLKIDDPVSKYLDFTIPGDDPKNPVTFRHILTHTSGLDGDFGAVAVWSNNAPKTLDDFVRTSLKVKQPPMTKVEYSNAAFALLAFLVEKISGVPYKQYIKENIWDPLEMTSTAFDPTPDMDERIAIPYVVDKTSGNQKPAPRIRAAVWPAGITYGTVLNQANWLILNLNNGVFKGKRIVSEATMEQMFTRQFDQFKGGIEGIWGNETAGFGLTWWVQVRNGERYFAHSGSVSGYTAFLLGNRDRKLGFAIMTNGNQAHPHLFRLADRAIDLMEKYSVGDKASPATGVKK